MRKTTTQTAKASASIPSVTDGITLENAHQLKDSVRAQRLLFKAIYERLDEIEATLYGVVSTTGKELIKLTVREIDGSHIIYHQDCALADRIADTILSDILDRYGDILNFSKFVESLAWKRPKVFQSLGLSTVIDSLGKPATANEDKQS